MKEEDVIEPDVNAAKTIIANVEAEKAEWERFKQQKTVYEQMRSTLKNRPIHAINPDDLMMYHSLGLLDGRAAKPKWKYGEERPPRLAVADLAALAGPRGPRGPQNPEESLRVRKILRSQVPAHLGIRKKF